MPSIHDELMYRLGSHKDHMKDVKAKITYPVDRLESPVFTPVYRFNYRYELTHARKLTLDLTKEIAISKQLLNEWYLMASDDGHYPFQLWSDPDTNDQICRLLLEDKYGSYSSVKVANRSVMLNTASVNDFRQAGKRYKDAGIFFMHQDRKYESLNLRIVNYFLPFSVQPPDDESNYNYLFP